MRKLLTVAFIAILTISFQNCSTTSQGTSIGTNASVSTVQKILQTGSENGFSILGNNSSFLTNVLIEAVMPEKLKSINSSLENVGLSSLVEKEKEYIAKAAQASVNAAKPIISSAIEEMTVTDAINIIAGGK